MFKPFNQNKKYQYAIEIEYVDENLEICKSSISFISFNTKMLKKFSPKYYSDHLYPLLHDDSAFAYKLIIYSMPSGKEIYRIYPQITKIANELA